MESKKTIWVVFDEEGEPFAAHARKVDAFALLEDGWTVKKYTQHKRCRE